MIFKKLRQQGHIHLVMPIVAIVAVGGIGAAYLALTHAATVSGCVGQTFQSGSKDSGSSHCVQYLQQMIDGRDAFIITENFSASTINATPASHLTEGSQFYSVGNQFGVTSGAYSTTMQSNISTLQKWDNAPVASYVSKYFNGMSTATFGSTFRPNGALPTSGVTETRTWYDDCQWTSHMPVSARTVTNSTDFTGGVPNSSGSNKTNMWYLRSYIRAAVSAASSANCAGAINAGKTTGTTNGGAPSTPVSSTWQLNGVTTSGADAVRPGASVTFTSVLTNSGSGKTASFVYGPRYFYSSTATPTHAANKGYTGETETAANKTSTGLAAGGSITAISQSVTVPTSSTSKYICGTVAYSPSNNAGGTDGRGPAICVAIASASAGAVPAAAPGSLTATASSGKLTVKWAAVSGATNYNVLVSGPSAGTKANSTVTVTSAVYSSATSGTNGSVRVRACNAAGCGAWSASKAFKF